MRLSASPEASRSTGTRSNGETNQIITYTCVGPQLSRYFNTLKAMNTENGMLCSKSPPTDEVRMHTQVECLAAGRSVHSRTSQLRIVQTRRHAYQLDYFWLKHNYVSAGDYNSNMHCTRDEGASLHLSEIIHIYK